jgi:hypothetical protein
MYGYSADDLIEDDIEGVVFLVLRHGDKDKGIPMQTIPWDSFMSGEFKKRGERKDRSQFKEAQVLIERQLEHVARDPRQMLEIIHTYQCNVTGLFIKQTRVAQLWLGKLAWDPVSHAWVGAQNNVFREEDGRFHWSVGALEYDTPQSWSGSVKGSSYKIKAVQPEAYFGGDEDEEDRNTNYWGAMAVRFGCFADGLTFRAPPDWKSVADPQIWSSLVGYGTNERDSFVSMAFRNSIFTFAIANDASLAEEAVGAAHGVCDFRAPVLAAAEERNSSKHSTDSIESIDSLEIEALEQIDACLSRSEAETGQRWGLVQIPGWDARYAGKLGSVRVFLERRPSLYRVERGKGRRFRVFRLRTDTPSNDTAVQSRDTKSSLSISDEDHDAVVSERGQQIPSMAYSSKSALCTSDEDLDAMVSERGKAISSRNSTKSTLSTLDEDHDAVLSERGDDACEIDTSGVVFADPNESVETSDGRFVKPSVLDLSKAANNMGDCPLCRHEFVVRNVPKKMRGKAPGVLWEFPVVNEVVGYEMTPQFDYGSETLELRLGLKQLAALERESHVRARRARMCMGSPLQLQLFLSRDLQHGHAHEVTFFYFLGKSKCGPCRWILTDGRFATPHSFTTWKDDVTEDQSLIYGVELISVTSRI